MLACERTTELSSMMQLDVQREMQENAEKWKGYAHLLHCLQ